jgi:hypothetical protein
LVLGPSLPENGTAEASPLDLEIFQQGYPRAFFFRQTEDDAQVSEVSFAEWEKRYLPLGGIMGKVLNEEHDLSKKNNLDWFLQYKANNPGKVVLLHYNGKGRRPTDEATRKFFAGHWLHYRGTNLTRALSGDSSATTLHVEDPSVFRLSRYDGALRDDIAIVPMTGGKPDWSNAEQVRLRSIDHRAKTIFVVRGAYGTRPRSFPTGSYLAAHVATGPFGSPEDPPEHVALWSYNLSTVGPRDAQGRNGIEALTDYLVETFGPGGTLSSFDGITLDVMGFSASGWPKREIDTDGDGRADGSVIDGTDVFTLGSLELSEALRRRLPDKLILSDGQSPKGSQRSSRHLNGVESEGYSEVHDLGLNGISKGENVFNFWKTNSASPSFNYVNFKYKDKATGLPRNEFEPSASEDQSYRKLRLALASAVFSDSVFTFKGPFTSDPGKWGPPPTLWKQGGVQVRVFDELWQGVDQIPNWLGMPLGPAVYLASASPDLLAGRGTRWPQTFIERFRGNGVLFSREEGTAGPGMLIRDSSPDASQLVLDRRLVFTLPGVEVSGKDLFVSLRLRTDPLEGYPAWVGRRVNVNAAGIRRLGSFTWANDKSFAAKFNFRDVGPGRVDLEFGVEGQGPVHFERLVARSAANAAYREFENGAVFYNDSNRSYTFELQRLFPGASFRRLRGTDNQDPTTNNGRPLGATLTLGPRNALFVVRTV